MGKPIRNGVIAAGGLILFYFIVMGISSKSWSATISQFQDLWYWMMLLSVGFGTQIGLYTKLKSQMSKLKTTTQNSKLIKSGKTIATTSGTASSISMVACCAHHLSEVLPIIGLSGAAAFLTRYQIPLIMLGVIMNGFGIFYMLKQIQKIKSHVSLKI
ncbi:hypothetical protein A3A46_03390 [Candidatus Roizmanbacteria bacterium RIFCSPLOWO2_01_FULL_37_13]|uniref:Uncharacterized protein n=1 Tax=Candidatus Roizmanbacteria bacterium RIFCSPHIGHO2_02_FULL_38_11 TaxID=1802039 RepID=A0A1F7GWI8_9BACT|nr:MAG: hypothetical protein A3C25_02225 [Candidatus Roizmanbacteria bacterium RIFCSPHIGHO2_02_FULL_38_11]OGK33688.1 MAG: hypothetical protein A3F58_02310 [Candidatus Roizmanbacteria bacterium RIFCSPHIGHO2_12_FULL_37_9b]OGK43171.1 MAG: hypothetical protein A3A46_03390 [Candidatus Roizmanbacteria bacterium RIFCSPLOWO2_01_FULL_37_13]